LALGQQALSLAQLARYDQQLREQFQSTFAFCEPLRKGLLKPWQLNLLALFAQHHRIL